MNPAPLKREGGTRVRALVLVGLPGSGKSGVGSLLARRLGWGFVDVDTSVEADTGRTIPELFRERGEAAFRRLERRATAAALRGDPVVVAPGGGWAAAPGALDTLPPDALAVWLRTRPDTAYDRLAGAGGRPLLEHDPRSVLERLARERAPFYERAELVVDTDERTQEAVAEEIIAALSNG